MQIDILTCDLYLQSSDFFDSVLSLQNDLEEGFLSSFEEDNNISSDADHSDEVLSPRSYSSESDKNSTSSSLDITDVEWYTNLYVNFCQGTNCIELFSAPVLNNVDGIDDKLLLSFLDRISQGNNSEDEPVVNSPSPVVVSAPMPTPKTTKILIQNPSNKKCIAKPIATASKLRS